ncbi:M91 family zinc metallopeptidase [Pedobacter sp. KLB.chiD]|uniref:M91 family zinc metallopeptidase n=1 Tax=Pedobacter sp. KLB.chiD TaxID=3387402 RepID=UPI00399B1FED
MKNKSKPIPNTNNLEENQNSELHHINEGNNDQNVLPYSSNSSISPEEQQMLVFASGEEILDGSEEEWDIDELVSDNSEDDGTEFIHLREGGEDGEPGEDTEEEPGETLEEVTVIEHVEVEDPDEDPVEEVIDHESGEEAEDPDEWGNPEEPTPAEDAVSDFMDKITLPANNSVFKANLLAALTAIAQSETGLKLLNALNATSETFIFSDQNQASAYNASTNTFSFINLALPASDFPDNYMSLTLGHELFHAYQDISGDTRVGNNYMSTEIDAFLFSARLAAELDIDFATDYSLLRDPDNEDNPEIKAEIIKFNNAWDDILENGFNVNSFNDLIDSFEKGTASGSSYDGRNTEHITSSDDVKFNKL